MGAEWIIAVVLAWGSAGVLIAFLGAAPSDR